MRVHHCRLKRGITRTKEFKKKGLAQYAANVGTRCGHQCTYCSTPALMRMHPSFKEAGESPFAEGYALVEHGHHEQAHAVGAVRDKAPWSRYVADLIRYVQCSVRRFHDPSNLRFLLYPDGLTPSHVAAIRRDDAGVVWLGKKQ
jgi:hypothetical protein